MATNEKDKLRGFVLTVLDYVGVTERNSSFDPIRRANDLRGLRTAAKDMVEMCQDLDTKRVAELDKLLKENDFPPLSEMRDRSLQRCRRILSQKKIRNDDEWRFLESYVSDVDSDVLTQGDREAANQLLGGYKD